MAQVVPCLERSPDGVQGRAADDLRRQVGLLGYCRPQCGILRSTRLLLGIARLLTSSCGASLRRDSERRRRFQDNSDAVLGQVCRKNRLKSEKWWAL